MSSRSTIRTYMGLTTPVYEMPKSVQQTIPIARISEEGIFQIEPDGEKDMGKRYDKAYLFLDTNYANLDSEEREDFRDMYGAFLNSLNVSFKILLIRENRDLRELEREILLKDRTGRHQEVADAYNEIIERKLMEDQNGMEQLHVFVITCERPNFTSAADYFRTVEANLEANFQRLSSTLIPLSAAERLKLLHHFYRVGHEMDFRFDYLEAVKTGRDFRNDIAPSSIREYKDAEGFPDGKTLKIDHQYVRVLYARDFPAKLKSDFIQEIAKLPFPSIVTMDYAPIPQKAARKRLYDLYMKNGNAINREQEIRNRNGNFADISFDKRRQQEQIELALNLVSDNNEKMSYFGLYVVITGTTYEELESHTTALTSISDGYGMGFVPAMYNQLNALNTCLPLGGRYCEYMRTVFSTSLTAFIPFYVTEVHELGGLYYGVNALSRNPILGDRKRLPNGNGVILAPSGMGKSVKAKTEIQRMLPDFTLRSVFRDFLCASPILLPGIPIPLASNNQRGIEDE